MLFKFLRMVDPDEYPSMGFIVIELLSVNFAKMAPYKHKERDWIPILNIIEEKGKDHLDSALHLATWFLNPLLCKGWGG